MWRFKVIKHCGIQKHKYEKKVYLFEYLDKLENKNDVKSKNTIEETDKIFREEQLTVRMNDLAISFIILAFGFVISFIVFITEIRVNT